MTEARDVTSKLMVILYWNGQTVNQERAIVQIHFDPQQEIEIIKMHPMDIRMYVLPVWE